MARKNENSLEEIGGKQTGSRGDETPVYNKIKEQI